MIILCDSRENMRVGRDSGLLHFEHEAIEYEQVTALPFGDYWCVYKDGTVSPFIFERKAIGDFFSSFSNGYKNERKKLDKFFENDYGINQYIVIIEGSISDILKGYKYSHKNGRDLIRTMLTWWNKYKVITLFMKRHEIEFFIPELFSSYGKMKTKEKLKKKGKNVKKIETKQ